MYFSVMFSVCCIVGLFVFLFYIYCLLLATINMQLDVYGLTNKFKRIIQSVIRYFSFMSTLSECCQSQWYYVGMFHALICCRFLRCRSFHTRIGTCYCPLTVSLRFLLILTLQKNSCWQACSRCRENIALCHVLPSGSSFTCNEFYQPQQSPVSALTNMDEIELRNSVVNNCMLIVNGNYFLTYRHGRHKMRHKMA